MDSKKNSKKFRSHITIGNDEIITHVYEIPKKGQRPQKPVVSLVEITRNDQEALYFPEVSIPRYSKRLFKQKI